MTIPRCLLAALAQCCAALPRRLLLFCMQIHRRPYEDIISAAGFCLCLTIKAVFWESVTREFVYL